MVGLCRLCASLKKPNLLITIKDQSNEICQKLQKCCKLKVQIKDNLPKSVCQECLESLNASYKFYTKVQEAQDTLEALFPGPTTETPSNKSNKTKTNESIEEALPPTTDDDKHRKTNTRMKKDHISGSTIKIKKEASTQRAMDEDAGYTNVFTISNVASALDDNDNDGYLQEVYNILRMTKGEISNHPNTLDENSPTFAENMDIEVPSKPQQQMDDDCIEENSEPNTFEKDVSEIEIEEVVIVGTVTEEEIELLEEEDLIEKKNNVEEIQIRVIDDIKRDFSNLPPVLQLSSWNSYTYLCYVCDYEATDFMDLSVHAQSTHSVDDINKLQYKCYDCQRVIGRYNSFLNHIRLRHHPALKLRCDACDKLHEDYQQYANHRDADCSESTNYPNYLPCRQCCKSFHTAYGLQTHMKQQHTELVNKESFQCTVCHKEFAQKRSLRSHEITHKQERKFACDFCDKLFFNKSNLETHLFTHCPDNLFKCHICNKSYKSDIILEKHQLLHTNLKPFQCSFCPRQFRTKIEQTSHERVHTGEMPLQCIHCEKRFRFRSALNAHLKVHSGVKAHACKYCPKTFIDISNFKKHVRRKHFDEDKADNKDL